MAGHSLLECGESSSKLLVEFRCAQLVFLLYDNFVFLFRNLFLTALLDQDVLGLFLDILVCLLLVGTYHLNLHLEAVALADFIKVVIRNTEDPFVFLA